MYQAAQRPSVDNDPDKALCVLVGYQGCETWAVFRQCCAAFNTILLPRTNVAHLQMNYLLLMILWNSLQMSSGSVTVKEEGVFRLRLQAALHNLCIFFLHSNLRHLPTGQSFNKYTENDLHCLNWTAHGISFGKLMPLMSLERVQQGAGVWADVVVFVDGLV